MKNMDALSEKKNIDFITGQNQVPVKSIVTPNRTIHSFVTDNDSNIDHTTVKSFGEEWKNFNAFSNEDIQVLGEGYFDIVTREMVNENTILGDFGCGSGRFIKYFQPIAKKLIGIDPSEAIFAADKLLGYDEKIELCRASISNIPYPDEYFDFAMSIGVLHHIPDTKQAMIDCVKKVKKGGYFFTYLYYSFDNRGLAFKILWKLSEIFRWGVSKLPQKLKMIACDILAVVFYMPFVLLSRMLYALKVPAKIVDKIPLSPYSKTSFFVIRNDSLDRFGTPLEQRYSKKEIQIMMEQSGLHNIIFSPNVGFWHAVGQKK